jgi:hypothetical protein
MPIESQREPAIAHTWRVLTRFSGGVLHSWKVVPVVATFGITHTWTVRSTPNAITHTWRVIPKKIVEMHSQNVQTPYGVVDKT